MFDSIIKQGKKLSKRLAKCVAKNKYIIPPNESTLLEELNHWSTIANDEVIKMFGEDSREVDELTSLSHKMRVHQRLHGVNQESNLKFHNKFVGILTKLNLELKLRNSRLEAEKESMIYDVALSFAGEDRNYVRKVAVHLVAKGLKVFYDEFEKVNLWGIDLYQYLNKVYKKKCSYTIIFISEHYAKKMWTKHELKSAQARAFKENKEYILPVRFDDTEIPAIDETIGYLDGNKYSPKKIAKIAYEKVIKNK